MQKQKIATLMLKFLKTVVFQVVLSFRDLKVLSNFFNLLLCVCVYVISCVWLFATLMGIFQAKILQLVAISYYRGSSWPRDQTWVSCVSCIGRQILYHCASLEALLPNRYQLKEKQHQVSLGGGRVRGFSNLSWDWGWHSGRQGSVCCLSNDARAICLCDVLIHPA